MSDFRFRLAIYANGFVLGFILMGFEMLSSRYLNPHFGSGIYTWAAIISVTLLALTVGYFIGGRLVDRYPSARLLGGLVLLSAVFMAAIALPVTTEDPHIDSTADVLVLWVIETFDVGPIGVTIGSIVLIGVPITLIACYSPFAVRLLLQSTEASGRQTGAVYGINTFGNILGTWVTSFYLVPSIGSLAITVIFAGVTTICGVSLLLLPRPQGASS